MVDKQRIEKAVKEILIAVGEDPNREGLQETPARVARMYEERFAGLERYLSVHTKKYFHESSSELVLVKDIDFNSTCEHHLLPIYGKGHIAYIPRDGKVIGLSKLARILEDISQRPQMQERITNHVADVLSDNLNPEGVFVILEAEHMCMSIRGIKKFGAKTITKAMRGTFADSRELRQEVLDINQIQLGGYL